MKRIYVVEDLCNGCRLCENFCSSLLTGVFSESRGRVKVLKVPGEEKSIPVVNCDGRCVRSIYEDGRPTCVGLCPTGALYYAEHDKAVATRLLYEESVKEHSIFKLVAPWKWPYPWRRPDEDKARSPEEEIV